MIPRSKWEEKKQPEKDGLVAVIEDNTILNDVYELVFDKNDITYKILHFNDTITEFITMRKPKCVLLEFDNIDILYSVIQQITSLEYKPRLIYHGLALKETVSVLNEKKVAYILYGNWKELIEALQ